MRDTKDIRTGETGTLRIPQHQNASTGARYHARFDRLRRPVDWADEMR
jgi:hypothetical protein